MELRGEDLSCYLNSTQSVGLWNVCMITSFPTKRISAMLQWKTFIRVYPQDGGESQMALKLRRCHPVNTTRSLVTRRRGSIGCSETRTVGAQSVRVLWTSLTFFSSRTHSRWRTRQLTDDARLWVGHGNMTTGCWKCQAQIPCPTNDCVSYVLSYDQLYLIKIRTVKK